eukprot:gene3430-2381_t
MVFMVKAYVYAIHSDYYTKIYNECVLRYSLGDLSFTRCCEGIYIMLCIHLTFGILTLITYWINAEVSSKLMLTLGVGIYLCLQLVVGMSFAYFIVLLRFDCVNSVLRQHCGVQTYFLLLYATSFWFAMTLKFLRI